MNFTHLSGISCERCRSCSTDRTPLSSQKHRKLNAKMQEGWFDEFDVYHYCIYPPESHGKRRERPDEVFSRLTSQLSQKHPEITSDNCQKNPSWNGSGTLLVS